MRLQTYLNEQEPINESRIFNILRDFANKTDQQIKSTLKDAWQKLLSLIKKEGKEKEALEIINKALKTRYTRLEQFNKVNETTADPEKKGFVNWLKSIIFQGTIGASIFTSLQVFFALDTILTGEAGSGDIKRLLVYAFLWTLLASKTYHDWRHGHQLSKRN